MDRSEVLAIAERQLTPLKELLGLADWEIKLSVAPETTDSDGFFKRGECTRLVDYTSAHITLNPEAIDDEAGLVETLRHELFHVVLAPWDLYTSLVAAAVAEDTPAREMLDRVRDHACERVVAGLERMWAAMSLDTLPTEPIE